MKITIKLFFVSLFFHSCINDKEISNSEANKKPIFYKCFVRNIDTKNGETSSDKYNNRMVNNQSVIIYLFNDSLAIFNYDTLKYEDILIKIKHQISELKSNKEIDFSDNNRWAWNKVKYYIKNDFIYIPATRSFSDEYYKGLFTDTSNYCDAKLIFNNNIAEVNAVFKIIN